MWKEFKNFIMRGNVLDLAIGIVIGTAFGRIITSLVSDIIMPPLGLLLGKVDFSNLYWNISGHQVTNLADAQSKGLATINYGIFLNNIINFIIVGSAVFLLIKGFNKMSKKPAKPADPTTKECPFCFTTISMRASRCPNCTSKL
jgi:large conductance mechanosensitive channel